jgi:hypothetical protein
MKIPSRLLLPALLLGAPLALAQSAAPQPQAEAPASTKTLDLDFRGTLRDAIQKLSREGGVSVIVTGDLGSTPVDVNFRGVTAEQALRTLARTYSLRLENEDGIYTVRALTAEEKAASARGPATQPWPQPPPRPHGAGLPPMPPVPPMPPHAEHAIPEDFDADEVRERMRERMREVRRQHRGGRDVVARGHSLEVKENEAVDSAVVYGGNLVVKGSVGEDAVAFGGNLEIFGHVEGDAHAFGGNVILQPGATVEGDVSSFGGTVVRSEDAHVEGSTESFGGANIGRLVAGELKNGLKEARKAEAEEERAEEAAAVAREGRDGSDLPEFLLWFATLFGLGFLGQLFFPTRMQGLSTEIRTQPVKSAVAGVLGLLALIPLSLVVALTIVGIPVALALWVVVLPLAAALGLAAVASEIGLRLPILRGRKTQAMVLAMGLLLLLVVSQIPVLGAIVLVLATMVGIGAVVRTRFGIRPKGIPEPIMPSSEPV